MEKIYEARRLDLKAMIDDMGRGAIAKVASDIGVDPNYLSRCLYPAGKKGKKNIGDETVIKLNDKYPQWSSKWKTGFIEGQSIRINEPLELEQKPSMVVEFKQPEKDGMTKLIDIASQLDALRLGMLINEAAHLLAEQPAKQTLSSTG